MFNNVQLSTSGAGQDGKPAPLEKVCFFYMIRLNVQEVQEITILKNFFDLYCSSYVFQKERGSNGIEHYQCMVKLNTKARRSRIRMLLQQKLAIEGKVLQFPNGSYCEPCKSWLKSKDYCMKSDTRIGSIYFKNLDLIEKQEFTFPELYDWQQEIVEIVKTEPNDRNIIYVNKNYRAGKSLLCKYLIVKHDALIVDGNENHILALVAGKPDVRVVVIDCAADNKRLCWAAVEKIKNGFFASHFGTKGTKMILLKNKVHVIVFSNNKLEKELKNRRIDRERFLTFTDEDEDEFAFSFSEEEETI